MLASAASMVSSRVRIWRNVLSQRWGVVPIVTFLLALIGLYDLVLAQVLSEDARESIPTVGEALASIAPWYVWMLAAAAVLLGGTLEGAYRVIDKLTTRSVDVEVISSYPVFHNETGVQPSDYYLLVGGLNIINHTGRELDCSLELEVRIEGEITVLQHIESSEIVNARLSLPEGLRGNQQLTEQIKIADGSRAVGFAAFTADFLTTEQIEEGVTAIDEMTLLVEDAVNLVALTQHEVWPWQWRDLLFGGQANEG